MALQRLIFSMMDCTAAVQMKGVRVIVVYVDVIADCSNKIRDAMKDATTDLLDGQVGEPAFNKIQPGRTGRHEVEMESGSFR